MPLPVAAIGLGLQGAGALANIFTGAGLRKAQKKLSNASENLLSLQRKDIERYQPVRQDVLRQLMQSAGVNVPLATPSLLNPPKRAPQQGQPGFGAPAPATSALPVAPTQAPAGTGQAGYDILGQRNPFLSGAEGLRLGAIEEVLANRQRLQQAQLGSALERRGLGGSATLGSAMGNLFTQGQRDYGQFARQLALEGPREQERRLLLLQGLLPGGTQEALAVSGGLGNLSQMFGQQAALGGQALGQFGQNLGYFGAMQRNPYASPDGTPAPPATAYGGFGLPTLTSPQFRPTIGYPDPWAGLDYTGGQDYADIIGNDINRGARAVPYWMRGG